MKLLARRIILAIFFCGLFEAGSSQPAYPEIGKPFPDILLKNIQGLDKKTMSTSDFRGRHFILDFFSLGCASCFASFPKLTKIQQEFPDSLQIILVGNSSSRLPKVFDKFKEKENIDLAVVYDSALCAQWEVHFFPFSVWVDEAGVVRAISNTIKRDQIVSFLKNEKFNFYNASKDVDNAKYQSSVSYHRDKLFLIDGNGGESDKFTQRSLLAAWNPNEQQYAIPEIDWALGSGKFETIGVGLWHLFNFAFYGNMMGPADSLYGNVFKYPILEVRDPSMFTYNYEKGTNFYSYSLVVRGRPVAKALFQSIMKNDLINFFGMTGNIERRSMPCLKLVVVDENKARRLKSGGKEPFMDQSYVNLSIRNYSVDKIILGLRYLIGDSIPLINDTKIEYNIDIDLQASLLNLQQVKDALLKYGLDLVDGKKEMEVLVIRDIKDNLTP